MTLDWGALERTMLELGLPGLFVKWIMKCVTAVSYKFLINGQHSSLVKAKRGLRQGDLTSPLLFVLVMEDLGRKPDFDFSSENVKR